MGAARHGGRFNPRGTPALYPSLDHRTACNPWRDRRARSGAGPLDAWGDGSSARKMVLSAPRIMSHRRQPIPSRRTAQ
ncbi:RES domain-containing protein [Thiocystis minor]|uniref:RES domain-containing protein n=1 Tax=Thiocystis minor TaxID=61597 RepID=UPI003B8332A4